MKKQSNLAINLPVYIAVQIALPANHGYKTLFIENAYNSLYAGLFLLLLLSSAKCYVFSKRYLLGTLSECQTVWIQIRTDVLSVQIWV